MRPLTETRQADEGRDRDKDTIRIKPVAVFGEWQDTGDVCMHPYMATLLRSGRLSV